MKNRKLLKNVWVPTLAAALFLSACSKSGDLPLPAALSQQSAALQVNPQAAQASAAENEALKGQLSQIIKGLDGIKASLDNLSIAPVSSGGSTSSSARKTTTTTRKSTTSTKKSSIPTRKPITKKRSTSTVRKTPAKPAGPDANAELKTVLNKLSSAPFIKATIDKTEKGLKTGKTKLTGLKFWTKQPNIVKLDVIKSSASPAGTKATYPSGVGTKLDVRPAGALSFVTTKIDKNDDRITSDNGFILDDMDFFGVSKRLSSGYTAKLIGRTTVAGKKINVLRVTASGTNSLSSDIQYEHIGYEPDTHTIRLWEMYANEKTPFFRLTLSSIEFPASIPASEFKI